MFIFAGREPVSLSDMRIQGAEEKHIRLTKFKK